MADYNNTNEKGKCNNAVFSLMLSDKATNAALLFLRCYVSFIMLTHAFAKVENFDALLGSFSAPFGMSKMAALLLIITIELGGSIFLMVGFLSRLALLGLISGMTTAAFFTFHPFAMAQSELAMMYLGVYIALFLTGPGKYSVDYLIKKAACKK